jgi:glutamate dehydrogenase
MIRIQELAAWSESRVRDVLFRHMDTLRALYAHFNALNGPGKRDANAIKNLEAQISNYARLLEDDFDSEVLQACIKFNTNVRRTNMWRNTKSSIVFEIDPECVSNHRRYLVKPFCVLLLVGSDFRGFHVRFSDIARGGVRLVKSRSEAEWQKNAAELFFENYRFVLGVF